MNSVRKCPHCGSGRSMRSRRRLIDLPLIPFGLRPYRCCTCERRFRAGGPPPLPQITPEMRRQSASIARATRVEPVTRVIEAEVSASAVNESSENPRHIVTKRPVPWFLIRGLPDRDIALK